MKTRASFTKETAPNRGLFGSKHPRWKGGITESKDYQKEYSRKVRKSVVECLGGCCQKCGFNDIRALQIDHINGGGSKERKTIRFSGSFHVNVMRSFLNKENKYQLLCANCNWIKRAENNEISK